ncbi:MAG TPA: sulfotransferase [Acidimicrobiales bacterium]|nr:sulfotransferase [Acidimicrobiales bacterium]
MSARPATVRIGDLGDPVLPAEVAAMAEAAAQAVPADLSAGTLKRLAVEATGLEDFGDDLFEEPLQVLATCLDQEAGLSPLGRFSAQGEVVAHLKNRLLVQEELKRHPEIHSVAVERPLVIAGLPRTGTTHLHNLLAADPAWRYLPYWEALEPVLAQAERPGPGGQDPRLARTEAALEALNSALPYFKRMHDMTTWHAHEEIQLLAVAGSTMLFETMALMPTWRDWYKATDQTPYYEYLRTLLKVLTWQRGGRRWVLKSPQHLEQFGPLMKVFPDATVVVTHRDPVSVTASLTTMVAYTARLALERVEPAAFGRYWADRVEEMLRRAVADRHLLPEDQSMDLLFPEFMADPDGSVRRVYELAGQPLTPEGLTAMEEFGRLHPRGRHGSVAYDLGDFSLDPEERRRALRFYSERFGVPDEPLGPR